MILSIAQQPTGAKAEYRLRFCTPSRSSQYGALGYKSAKVKQACALCFRCPSLSLCAIGARSLSQATPIALPLQRRSPPAR